MAIRSACFRVAPKPRLTRTIEQWRTLGIDGWNGPSIRPAPLILNGPAPIASWLTLAETAAEKLAPLLRRRARRDCVTGQTTANLHQLLATLV